MSTDFSAFLECYPPDARSHLEVDSQSLSKNIVKYCGVSAPQCLREFWTQIGSGYFGNRELYFFCDGSVKTVRSSLIEWNRSDFWPELVDPPSEGGPVFFAETCFGDQLGFRLTSREYSAVLFAVDTIELFVVADQFSDLFTRVLSEPHALVDSQRLQRLRSKLGPLPDGMHFSPIVSPLIGGSDKTSNFHFESPNVHLRATLATYQALQRQAPEDEGSGGNGPRQGGKRSE